MSAVRNQDKALAGLHAIQPKSGLPILTNNFDDPTVNPIFWGPNQPWVDINTYEAPTTWRSKEVLSIPRVTRMCIAQADACSYKGTDGAFDIADDGISFSDGFYTVRTTGGFTLNGESYDDGTIIRFASDSIFFASGINILVSGGSGDPTGSTSGQATVTGSGDTPDISVTFSNGATVTGNLNVVP